MKQEKKLEEHLVKKVSTRHVIHPHRTYHAKASEHILEVTRSAQYKTVDELFERSHPNSVYYLLLFLSAFIITPGLLLNNSYVVIGGMLVTPVLTPVLTVSLVPPICLVGIWLSSMNFEAIRFYFLLFLFNLLGVLVGSLVVFSLLKFYKIEEKIEETAEDAMVADE